MGNSYKFTIFISRIMIIISLAFVFGYAYFGMKSWFDVLIFAIWFRNVIGYTKIIIRHNKTVRDYPEWFEDY